MTITIKMVIRTSPIEVLCFIKPTRMLSTTRLLQFPGFTKRSRPRATFIPRHEKNMNGVWFVLIVGSILAAAYNGQMEALTHASIESAKSAVTLALGLVGVMAFWLGMMRILQAAGFLHILSRALRPLMVWLFPEVPANHPAMSAMIMNMASNMMGLGNAATPFGIKAMQELDRINTNKGTATNAMVLFLAINTSNVALAPLGVIALRSALGSENAAGIWLPTLIATSFSTLVAIMVAKGLARLPMFKIEENKDQEDLATKENNVPGLESNGADAPKSALGCGIAVLSTVLLGAAFFLFVSRGMAEGQALGTILREAASGWLLPTLMLLMVGFGVARNVKIYDEMIEGAKEGFQVALRIIPFLVAIIVAAGMFRASGLLELVIWVADPFLSAIGMPAEALPMAILRPLSGSGAYGVMAEIMQANGPDTIVGYIVSTMQGSTETTFYVMAVYFGAVGIVRVRHSVLSGLIADLAGVFGAVYAVRWLLTPLG